MFKKISRFVITFLGATGGLALGMYGRSFLVEHEILKAGIWDEQWMGIALCLVCAVILGVISWFLSAPITRGIIKLGGAIDDWQSDKSIGDLAAALIALIMGLLVAFLLSGLTNKIPIPALALTVNVLLYLMCPYICVRILWKRRSDLNFSFLKHKKKNLIPPKVIDLSAATDGRLIGICKTGFVEGCIMIPDFVADELKAYSQSDDELKAMRGNRGLDSIQEMQDRLKLPVEIRAYTGNTDDYEASILGFVNSVGGTLITTDRQLARSARIHNIRVVNINELTNAVKIVLIPGDECNVRIVREGKERAQGLGYLEDGTMIVVEEGKYHVGESVDCTVTSVLQTAAGRMVFAELK